MAHADQFEREAERVELRRLQKPRRDDDGYGKVTVILMLAAGRSPATVAQELDEATGYHYAQAFATQGLAQYLVHDRPGSWGRRSRAPLADRCQEGNQRSTRT